MGWRPDAALFITAGLHVQNSVKRTRLVMYTSFAEGCCLLAMMSFSSPLINTVLDPIHVVHPQLTLQSQVSENRLISQILPCHRDTFFQADIGYVCICSEISIVLSHGPLYHRYASITARMDNIQPTPLLKSRSARHTITSIAIAVCEGDRPVALKVPVVPGLRRT